MNIQNQSDWCEQFLQACNEGALEKVRLLCQKQYVDKGWANIHFHREAAFHSACSYGYLDLVKYLLTSPELKKAGHTLVNLHAIGDYGFRMACARGHLDIVKYLTTSEDLIEAGHTWANPQAKGNNALWSACEYGHLNVIEYLLTSKELVEAGHAWCDVHANQEEAFFTVCEKTHHEKHKNIMKWLILDYGIKKTDCINEIIQKYPLVQEFFRVREELKEIQCLLNPHPGQQSKTSKTPPLKL